MGYDNDNDAVEIDDNYFVPLHLLCYELSLRFSALMRRFHGERVTSLFFDHVQSWEGVVSSALKY